MSDSKPPTPLEDALLLHAHGHGFACKFPVDWFPSDARERLVVFLSLPLIQALSDPAMRAALEVIVAERERQIEGEGWSRKHDDQHDNCELAMAAAHFACADTMATVSDPYGISDWASSSTTHLRNLEKAGALIVAEIERIHRALKAKETK